MEKFGIWIDSKEAFVMDEQGKALRHLTSAIEDYHVKGGYRGKVPYAAQDGTSDTKILARRTKQINDFCGEVLNEVKHAKALFIFGPAQLKKELEKHAVERTEFKATQIVVESSDSLTENQRAERVRLHFG